MKRLIATLIISGALALPASTAFALEPYTGSTDPTNCLGQDRAGFAHDGIPLFGIEPGSGVALNLIKVFATAGGIGDEVQGHRAGTGLADPISTCNE